MSLARLLQAALFPFSLLYLAASSIDGRRKQRRAYRASLFVVSVGNIGVGGSGKSQLVEALAQSLGKAHPVLVLSRGYGRAAHENVVWYAGDPMPDPEVFGDEPAMLARCIRRGGVAVGRDRSVLLRQFEHRFRDAIVILDDGFQHRQVARDIDIVIVDDATATPPHVLMPAGRLRERPRSIARASLIVATSREARSLAERYAASDRIFDAETIALGLRSRATGVEIPAIGSRAILVTGIANPTRVVKSLDRLGAVLVKHLKYGDHHRYSRANIASIAAALAMEPNAILVTTSKDAVKLERIPELARRIAVLETQFRIADEDRFLRVISDAIARHVATFTSTSTST